MFSWCTRDICFKKLRKKYKIIIFDMDGTVVSMWDKEKYSAKSAVEKAKRLGFRIVIISNSHNPEKKKIISQMTGIPKKDILTRHDNNNLQRFKPFFPIRKAKREQIRKALGILKVNPDEAIFIGNNILTDGLASFWGKMSFCLVIRP